VADPVRFCAPLRAYPLGLSASVVTVSLTASGADLGDQLPFPHVRGELAATVRERWPTTDGLVLVCATGIAVRVIAPLLTDKHRDPAVVCLDDAGRWAIALAGGHRGANTLARQVAGLVGAEPVVTTGTDSADVPALDDLPGFRAEGDVTGVTRAWLDGEPPVLDHGDLPGWPLGRLAEVATGSVDGHPIRQEPRVSVTDRVRQPEAGEVLLRPPSLVVGVGSSSGADPADISQLLAAELREAGLASSSVGLVATVDLKWAEPGIVALAHDLGVDLRTFPARVLAAVDVPNPSLVVADAVGTGSVAEAAALLAAGPDATLVLPKRRSAEATVAVARRVRPEGRLAVVGLGPGHAGWRTSAAAVAVRSADVVVGYGPYIDQAADLMAPHHEIVRSPIGAEVDRCTEALQRAARGQRVALVCSGDPGVFAMASLVCELAPDHGDPSVTIVPGVTAASAAAAVLGAPLGHDHASVSLSDLLTPWAIIERRVRALAGGDLVVAFYNPRSARRSWQLGRALAILSERRPTDCPVAVVTDVARPGQRVLRTTLAGFEREAGDSVGMLSLVVVGASATRWLGNRMVTPRGYRGRST
jgi:cobalt-precorrin 5A hydrolase/precorrin-3B C17-methyltransferase